jgi:endogenous inhibitor of DNA gyrase (YacG/DUF329 family)
VITIFVLLLFRFLFHNTGKESVSEFPAAHDSMPWVHLHSLDGPQSCAYLCRVAGRTCPTCKRTFEGDTTNPFRPFCSERCRSADLGNWLNASYRILAPVSEEDLDSGMPDGMPSQRDRDDPDVN